MKYKVAGFIAARLFGGKSEAILDSLIAFNVRSIQTPMNAEAQEEFTQGVSAYIEMNRVLQAHFLSQFSDAGYWSRVYCDLFDDVEAAWDFYSILERAAIGDRAAFFKGYGIEQPDLIQVGNLIWDRRAWFELMNKVKKGATDGEI